MSLISPKIIDAAWRVMPGPLRRRLRSQGGRRLIRFAPAAVLALCATQLTYFILQLANVTAGIAGATGWFAGAIVSYLVSRWAWERKGRPHLLKETLPFVSISICVGIVLTLASKAVTEQARDLGLHGLDKVLFAQGGYLAANCATFVVRFMIFHYVLFNDRGPKSGAPGPPLPPGPAAGSGPEPFAMTPSANGSAPARDGLRSGRPADPRTPRTPRARR
jgi:putative flippase GtrA